MIVIEVQPNNTSHAFGTIISWSKKKEQRAIRFPEAGLEPAAF